MSTTSAINRPVARHRRTIGYSSVLLAMLVSLWLGSVIEPPSWLRYPMLFGHLTGVIVGLGAAILLESKALLWAMGRAHIGDIRMVERIASPLAWIGLGGLLATGAFLEPNLENPLTAIKMVAVTVAALNGVALTRLTAELHRLPPHTAFRRVPWQLRAGCIGTSVTSQLAWWTAVIVGMLNTAS